MNHFDDGESSSAVRLIAVIIAFGALVAFQQSYARSHNYGIEQPVGYFGIAEYFFRHPEKMLGL
jgi:hypothetical protein